MYGLSGDNPHSDPPVEPFVPPGNGFLDLFEDPEELPSWLAEADIDTLATEFTEAGFTSALHWYRNWQLTAPWEGAQYRMPGRYVTVTWSTGSRDGPTDPRPAHASPGHRTGTHPARLRPLHRRGALRPGQCDAAGIPGFAEKLTG